MRKPLVAGISAAALCAAPALAADMAMKAPPPPTAQIFSWTGFYIGGYVGGGWNGGSVIGNPLPDPVTYGFEQETIPMSGGGALGGGQVGYNWQMLPTFLLGVEADFSWSGIRGSGTVGPIQSIPPGAAFAVGSTATASSNVDWLSSLRGRVGYTWDRFLAYATGGVARGRENNSANEVFLTGVTNPGASTATQTGWVVGGGLEYAWTDKWAVRAEYLYYNLANDTFVGARVPVFAPFGVQYVDKVQLNVIRIGLGLQVRTLKNPCSLDDRRKSPAALLAARECKIDFSNL
jgi:outer membrane immunogenic protein